MFVLQDSIEVCNSYADHGHCDKGQNCDKSHNIDRIVRQKVDGKRRKVEPSSELATTKLKLGKTKLNSDNLNVSNFPNLYFQKIFRIGCSFSSGWYFASLQIKIAQSWSIRWALWNKELGRELYTFSNKLGEM